MNRVLPVRLISYSNDEEETTNPLIQHNALETQRLRMESLLKEKLESDEVSVIDLGGKPQAQVS